MGRLVTIQAIGVRLEIRSQCKKLRDPLPKKNNETTG